jgi:hypothetical protein
VTTLSLHMLLRGPPEHRGLPSFRTVPPGRWLRRRQSCATWSARASVPIKCERHNGSRAC